jgi:uncharacterized protein YndB with AHSA1/START domain
MHQRSEATTTEAAEIVLEIVRDFDAPPQLVFDMWIDDEHLKRWLPVKGAKVTELAMQIRKGGKWRARIRAEDAGEFGLSGEFREVAPYDRLVMTHRRNEGAETLVTIGFSEVGGRRTRMRFLEAGFDSLEMRDAHEDGWKRSFEQLEGELASSKATADLPAPAGEQRILELERVFDAPRALVYRLWTEPRHTARWWGPRGSRLTHSEMDFRVGGKWRMCMTFDGGVEHWTHGEYREIRPPERLVMTYVNDADGHEMLVEIDFAEEGERTRLKLRQSVFLSLNERDGHRGGWSQTLDAFAAYIEAQGRGRAAGEPTAKEH